VRLRSRYWVAALGVAIVSSSSFATIQESQATPSPAPVPSNLVVPTPTARSSKLPAGTPVVVMTNGELSTKASKAGDRFQVTVLHDVTEGSTVVIPKGTIGNGEVTFATNNGGFGKPGILSISLRDLDLNGAKVLLDGRYREEGANKNGATAATWFAVGVFSGFIKGKPGVIPKGRELKARTGEDIAFSPQTNLNAAVPEAASTQPVNAKTVTPPTTPVAGSNDPKTGGFE
jgi:hypothetical protein